MTTHAIVNKLKDENQDYEWYPSTKRMLNIIANEIDEDYGYHTKLKLLDIGAGNGNALYMIKEHLDESEKSNMITMYAIEKSKILIEQMDKQIIVIGTNFHQQTLIDKNMDIIFSNPPYSEFSEWTVKIIREAQAIDVYMILPVRWKKNEQIQEAMKSRKAKHTVLDTLSFVGSEYRKARVEVDIVKINLGYKGPAVDPFDLWFDEYFSFSAQKVSETSYEFAERKKKRINELVTGKNVIERMVELYNNDIQDLMNNYKKLGELDASLLKELNVDISSLRKALEERVVGLKNIYWDTVFNRLEEITSRLTVDSRKALFGKLTETTSIDFTEDNIYMVIIWIIKHSNSYYDKQLTDVYYRLSRTKNVQNYKSNKRFLNDRWRYCRDEKTHYKLEYRIVYEGWAGLQDGCGLKDTTRDFISDVFAVANNLGFRNIGHPSDRKWFPGKVQSFTYFDLSTEDREAFCRIKVYKNGNIHFQFNQKFMRKLNVEAARLNGWVKDPKEAAKEMEIPVSEVEQAYKSNCQFKLKDIKLLTKE